MLLILKNIGQFQFSEDGEVLGNPGAGTESPVAPYSSVPMGPDFKKLLAMRVKIYPLEHGESTYQVKPIVLQESRR